MQGVFSAPPWSWPERAGKERRVSGASNGGTAKRLRRKRTEDAPLTGSRFGGLSSPAEKFGGFPLEESLVEVIDEASRGFRVAPWALRRAPF